MEENFKLDKEFLEEEEEEYKIVEVDDLDKEVEEAEDEIVEVDDCTYPDDVVAASNSRGGPKKKKKTKEQAKQPQLQQHQQQRQPKDQSKRNNSRLRPAHEIYNRIKWDPSLKDNLGQWSMGYLDRFVGIVEVPFLEFLTVDNYEGVPFHRVRYYKFNGEKVWDRDARLDILSYRDWTEPDTKQSEMEQCSEVNEQVQQQKERGQRKAVLLSSGSFCPIHLNHINMLELAKQHLEDKRGYQVIAGVFCPTPDTILRKKFKSQPKREWIKVDRWAANNSAPAAKVHQHVFETYNPGPEGTEIEVIPVFGADTIQKIRSFKNKTSSMVCVINRRYDFDVHSLFAEKVLPAINHSDKFIDLIESKEVSEEEIGATVIRNALTSGKEEDINRVKHLLHPDVLCYILENQLFRNSVDAVQIPPSSLLNQFDIEKKIMWEALKPDDSLGQQGKGISSDLFVMWYGGQQVAVKVSSFTTIPTNRDLRYLFNEIAILSETNHDGIVKYLGAGIDIYRHKMFIVLEYANGSSLVQFLSTWYRESLLESNCFESEQTQMQRKDEEREETARLENTSSAEKPKELKQRWSWGKDRMWGEKHNVPIILKAVLDVAKAMRYLHSVNIIHRDLSVDNVLVFYHGEGNFRSRKQVPAHEFSFKVADFGISQRMNAQQHLVTVRGHMRNYAPESVHDNKVYTLASDVFMFGFLMYQVLEGREVYTGMKIHKAITRTIGGKRPQVTLHNDKVLDGPYVSLMRQCWDQQPDNRPSFEQICEQLERLVTESL